MTGKRRTDLDPTFLKGVERTTQRRGARVVEWAGFENRCAFTGTVGSNPTLSASFFSCGSTSLNLRQVTALIASQSIPRGSINRFFSTGFLG